MDEYLGRDHSVDEGVRRVDVDDGKAVRLSSRSEGAVSLSGVAE
jgi:hypothetical protein